MDRNFPPWQNTKMYIIQHTQLFANLFQASFYKVRADYLRSNKRYSYNPEDTLQLARTREGSANTAVLPYLQRRRFRTSE